jgi:hypothetical protein
VRLSVSVALIAGCTFDHANPIGQRDAAVVVDAAVDSPSDAAIVPFCSADPHLRLCYSFDADPFPTSMPNEGAATVTAQLTSVTRGNHLAGGAAELTTASIIYLPEAADVTAIQTLEVSFRADTSPPTNLARIGIIDSNILPPNISLFLYRADPGYQLRCGLGSALYTYDAPGFALGTWHRAVCTCNADTLQLYLDDVKIGETPTAGCSAGGAIAIAGLTLGSNNNGGPTGVNEWLIGAVDSVRFWDVHVTPQR